MSTNKSGTTQCETCSYYYYDEESDNYECEVNLDEDEMEKFLSYADFNCPYYNSYDEYKIVKKQN